MKNALSQQILVPPVADGMQHRSRRCSVVLLLFASLILAIGNQLCLSQESAKSSRRQQTPEASDISHPVVDIDADISQMIQQLGDDNYQTRVSAEAGLKLIGRPAILPLSEIVASDAALDTEILLRAERLLILIKRDDFTKRSQQFLAAADSDEKDFGFLGWHRFAEKVGNNRNSRQLFMRMYQAHEPVFRSLLDPDEYPTAVRTEASKGLRKYLSAGLTIDTLNCIMFATSINRDQLVESSQSDLTANNNMNGWSKNGTVVLDVQQRKLFERRLKRAETVTYVKSCQQRKQIQKLLSDWLILLPRDISSTTLRLDLVESFELTDQTTFLIESIKDVQFPISTRVRSLQILIGLLEDLEVNQRNEFVARLEPLLGDQTLFGKFPSVESKQMIHVQLRDLVLGACIYLTDAQFSDFGLPESITSPRPFDRTRCGFLNDQARNDAFQRWQRR